jgi:gliding motility-associated-like protein
MKNTFFVFMLLFGQYQAIACILACDFGDGVFKIFAGDAWADTDTVCVGDTLLFTWVNYEESGRENFSFDWTGLNDYVQVIGPTNELVVKVIVNKTINDISQYPQYAKIFFYNDNNTIDSCFWGYPLAAIYCQPPQSLFSAPISRICLGECVTYNTVADIRIAQKQWYFEGGTPSTFIGETPPPICYAQAGKFDVRLISLNDAGSDTLLQTDYVTVFDAPQEAGNDVLVKPNQGESLVLMPCVIATHYNWYQNDQIICTDCPFYEYTPYGDAHFSCVAYNDTLACATTCHYEIVVQNVKDDLLIPTAFSPNGDGVNDILTPIPFNALLLSLQIYDRWGTLIYDHRDSNAAWQGNYNNMPCEQGTYVYVAEYERLYDHSKQFKKGSVVLIR